MIALTFFPENTGRCSMHSPANAWEQELLSLHTRLAPLFHHPGPQQRSLAYLRG
ncbi:hypothetical protein XNC1_4610 [Xenorhabdus nematophila ATCC 19061]|uniref:Uncharacterized protein n=1 Tax=Xenorhabdus nematophila (strain ATCC 19061 / DSM 3370 / CCUG 14189 / LMG 1036 / NCIMB 9965 / AN6) TaxID=406817 RepID=D3VFW6_XENNA|nr:hypothetical protein XNC1_4610 [Xenorhabdus nematophila ATCC 19061]